MLFSGAQSSGGGGGSTLTTLTLLTTDATSIAANSPFELGVTIAPGALVSGQALQVLDASSNAITVQEDNHHTDLSGNIRFVKLTGLLASAPGASSSTVTLKTVTGSPVTSNPITLSNLLAQTIAADTFECKVTCTFPTGTVYTALATTALNASNTWSYGSAQNRGTFRSGPLCTEWICSAPLLTGGSPHPFLTAQFHITAYKAGAGAWDNTTNPITGVKCTVILENGFALVSTPRDLVYDLLIQVGAANLTTGLLLDGSSPAATLTLGATSGIQTGTLSTTTWAAASTTAPNSQDIGKAIVEVGGNGRGWIMGRTSSTVARVNIDSNTPFSGTSFTSGNWKKMGVYHPYMTRIDSYFGGHGDPLQVYWGTAQKVVAALPYTYIINSQMVLNYGANKTTAGNPDLTNCNTDGVHPAGVNGGGGMIKNFGLNESNTGDVDHIGVMSFSFTAALLNWTYSDGQHLNARKLCFYNSRVGNMKPFWFRDETHGGTISIDSAGCLYVSTVPNNTLGVPVTYYQTSTPWYEFATNHSGATSYLPYLMSGDFMHLENLATSSNDYSLRTHQAGIFKTYPITFTNASASVTIGTGYPQQTGEAVVICWTGTPAFGGSNINSANTYYVRIVDATHINFYDTHAHALAGGGTGLQTCSNIGSTVFIQNGYGKSCSPPSESDAQTRSTAWNSRVLIQELAVFPDTIAAGLIDYSRTKTSVQRRLDTFATWMKTRYVDNSSYQAGGPRYLDLAPSGGPNRYGPWQVNYLRLANMNGYETGVQSADYIAFNDWLLADSIAWCTTATGLNPYEIPYGYYIRAVNNAGTKQYTYAGIAQEAMKTAIGVSGGVGTFVMAGQSATISSAATQSAVTVTLNSVFFDTVNPTRHVGSWIMFGTQTEKAANFTSGSADVVVPTGTSGYYVLQGLTDGGPGGNASVPTGTTITAINSGTNTITMSANASSTATGRVLIGMKGVGQITSITDNKTCVADSTVTTWDSLASGRQPFYVASTQTVILPFMSWGNVSTVAGTDCNYGNPNQGDQHYSWLANSGIELAYQRGIDTSNYASAAAFMAARGLPSNPPTYAQGGQPFVGCGSAVKANVVHR